jgi:hypothetical protein
VHKAPQDLLVRRELRELQALQVRQEPQEPQVRLERLVQQDLKESRVSREK